MIVVAVENLDIDASFAHAARQRAELTRHILLQPLNEHFPFLEDSDPGRLQCPARGRTVREEEMSDPAAIHDPSPSTLDAHPGAAQSLPNSARAPGLFSRAIAKSFMAQSPSPPLYPGLRL